MLLSSESYCKLSKSGIESSALQSIVLYRSFSEIQVLSIAQSRKLNLR